MQTEMTHNFGEQLRGNALKKRELSVKSEVGIDTVGNVQAVHINDIVDIKVIIEGFGAIIGFRFLAEVAFALDIMVHSV